MATQDLLAAVEDALKEPEDTQPAPEVIDAEVSESRAKMYATNVVIPTSDTDDRKQDYPEVALQSFQNPDRFYQPEGSRIIKKQIQRIIENEGPITADLVTRRVAQEWGFTRVASKIKRIVQEHLPGKPVGNTFWPDSIDRESYRQYRVADREVRRFEDVPLAELCNAGLDILEKYIAYPKEDLAGEIARHFGFSRVTKSTAQICEVAIGDMLERQSIVLDGDVYKIM